MAVSQEESPFLFGYAGAEGEGGRTSNIKTPLRLGDPYKDFHENEAVHAVNPSERCAYLV